MWHAWEKLGMYTEFQSENLNGRDHLGNLSVDDKVIVKWV
jgi:hypothetical protein